MIKESEKIKFKPINLKERAVYLRRLMRFKYPPDKRNRVYRQILTAHTVEPKVSNKIFDTLLPAEIDKMVSQIWNFELKGDFKINQKIWANDVRCFNSKKMIEDMLGASFQNISELCQIFENSGYEISCNPKTYDDFYFAINEQFPLIFDDVKIPYIKKVLLVEGATEEILLPKFALIAGLDFEKEGVFLTASGGKNQVVKDYLFHRENLNLKIAVILDSDAKEQSDSINAILRGQDDILLLEDGEFEDLLPLDLILKVLNKEFKNTAQVFKKDLQEDLPMTQKLYELYKIKGFGEFKKVEFAHLIFDSLRDLSDLGEKILQVVEFIKK